MPTISQFLRILLGTLTHLGTFLLLAYIYNHYPEAVHPFFLAFPGLISSLCCFIGFIRLNLIAIRLVIEG